MAIYYNRLEASEKAMIEEAVNPIQMTIDLAQSEHELFESLIEVDFAEAYNEAGILALNEEEQAAAENAQKEGIWKRIKAALEKAWAAIKKFFSDLFIKIKAVIKANEKLKKQYGEAIKKADLSKITGKGKDVKMPETLVQVTSELDKLLNDDNVTVEQANALNEKLADVKIEATEVELASIAQYIETRLDAGDMQSKVSKNINTILDALKKRKDSIDRKAGGNAEAAAKAAELYKAISALIKVANKVSSLAGKVATAELKAARENYIRVGMFAMKQVNGKAEAAPAEGEDNVAKESAYEEIREFAMLFMNESFIEDTFAYSL